LKTKENNFQISLVFVVIFAGFLYIIPKLERKKPLLLQPLSAPIHLRHYSLVAEKSSDNGKKIKFVNPNVDNYDRNIKHAASLGLPCYQKNQFEGRAVIVCGSGPSLKNPEVLDEIRRRIADDNAILVACKKAIKYLYEEGFQVDWAVSMDPGDHIANDDRMFRAPNVKHLIASSSDPAVFEWLKDEDVTIFHSATGYEKEVRLYKELFDNDMCMGGGYNVVNRAVSAFLYMGCKPMVLAGTDCGWREGSKFYVDETNNRPGVDMCDNGAVDGTPWMTRPDMLASAVSLAKLAKSMSEKDFVMLGDTIPSKLRYKDNDFLDNCARMG